MRALENPISSSRPLVLTKPTKVVILNIFMPCEMYLKQFKGSMSAVGGDRLKCDMQWKGGLARLILRLFNFSGTWLMGSKRKTGLKLPDWTQTLVIYWFFTSISLPQLRLKPLASSQGPNLSALGPITGSSGATAGATYAHHYFLGQPIVD